jgi:hypothetical protein
MVHQQYLKQVKVFFLPEWKKLTRRWKIFIAYSVGRTLLPGGGRRSWILWWKAIQFVCYERGVIKRKSFSQKYPDICSYYTYLLYHSEVRWLSRVKVLQGAVTLRNEIETLLSEKSSHISKVLVLWEAIWGSLSFTYSSICRNHVIRYLVPRA